MCLFVHLFTYLKRTLNTASEVKKWIPGIKREIDYCLDVSIVQQLQGTEIFLPVLVQQISINLPLHGGFFGFIPPPL